MTKSDSEIDFRDARRRLDDLAVHEAAVGAGRLHDREHDDTAYHRRQTLAVKRMTEVRRLRPSLRCECGKEILDPSRWVINRKERWALCKACAVSRKKRRKKTMKMKKLFPMQVVRWELNGDAFEAAWTVSGLSVRQIADKLAVSPTTVVKWMRTTTSTVSESTKREICDLLAANGVTLDE